MIFRITLLLELQINGIDVHDARLDQVTALLAGAGTLVDLELLRPVVNSSGTSLAKPTCEFPYYSEISTVFFLKFVSGVFSLHPFAQ